LASYVQQTDGLTIEKSFVRFKKQIQKPQKGRILQFLKYAAAILLIFSFGVLSQKFLLSRGGLFTPLSHQFNEIHVPNGEKTELTLADGSKVWLNAGTNFRVPTNFDENHREVSLSGEAFFEVKKGTAPFTVNSEYGVIQVLGTSFNVRAYDNLQFKTTLTEGKIQFSSRLGKKVLLPGQQLTLSEEEELLVRKIDPEIASSWKNGVIAFENEPLGDLAKRLERHFDITINLDQDIASIRFTGQVFEESLDEVMEYIHKTKPIKYAYDKTRRTLKIEAES
jgi:ferric-dicitrate binding protein FerR (iron transport regulator)